jgi:hypothetical protein
MYCYLIIICTAILFLTQETASQTTTLTPLKSVKTIECDSGLCKKYNTITLKDGTGNISYNQYCYTTYQNYSSVTCKSTKDCNINNLCPVEIVEPKPIVSTPKCIYGYCQKNITQFYEYSNSTSICYTQNYVNGLSQMIPCVVDKDCNASNKCTEEFTLQPPPAPLSSNAFCGITGVCLKNLTTFSWSGTQLFNYTQTCDTTKIINGYPTYVSCKTNNDCNHPYLCTEELGYLISWQ